MQQTLFAFDNLFNKLKTKFRVHCRTFYKAKIGDTSFSVTDFFCLLTITIYKVAVVF